MSLQYLVVAKRLLLYTHSHRHRLPQSLTQEREKLVTGSLQIKGLVYYVVLNIYVNNKRTPKWIHTTIIANGKKETRII